MTTKQNLPANSQRDCAGAELGLGPASGGAVGPHLLCGRVTSQGDAVVLGKGHTLVHKCRRSSRARAALDCPGALAAPLAWPQVPSLAPFQAHSDPPLPGRFPSGFGKPRDVSHPALSSPHFLLHSRPVCPRPGQIPSWSVSRMTHPQGV